MQVVCCQVDTVWEDKAATHARVASLLEVSPPSRGALVVLPEQFSTGSSFDLARIAEADERPSETFLAETAAKLGVYLIGGVVTRGSDGRGRNEAVVFGPDGREITRYCK
ncbi:MAG: nitrilase-related carbon-nitrogen hydrolase, partial [Phycisphaeraceae bacterium]